VSGYTPIFRSVFDGTLHGKWPQTGVWLALLAMVDRHGQIDRYPQAIASDIGIDIPTLLSCIAEFCKPDEMSRTRDHDGRRLELIDPDRPWGWKVLNHGKYREKARKAAYDADRTASGADAARKQAARQPVPTSPAKSRADPLSDSDTDTDKKKTYVGQEPDVVRVFDHWKTVHGKTRSKLDDKRRKLIRSALKTYDADTLCRSIDGYKRSEWHQGKNERRTVYDDIELMLRDAKQIDAGLTYVERGAQIQW
jgi:hypothetical protein